MKPTKFLTLVAWLVPSVTAGYLYSKFAIANGAQIPVTPLNLILTLGAISIILGIFAAPMFRYRKALAELKKNPGGSRPKRLNPFYAVRLVVLAKATAIAGAIFSGWQLGVIWMQVSSPVIPDSVIQNVIALIAAILMVAVGLVIERICRIPDDGAESEASQSGEAIA